MTLGEFVAVAGLCFGLAGFVLGVLNYLRDRAKLVVTLQWDMEVTKGNEYDHKKLWGVIRVTNIGRRTTYISHPAIRLPKGYKHSLLLISAGIEGTKLAEGDPTKIYMVSQDGLEKYAKDWRKLVAQISDTTGKVWKSERLRENEVPSWAKSPK